MSILKLHTKSHTDDWKFTDNFTDISRKLPSKIDKDELKFLRKTIEKFLNKSPPSIKYESFVGWYNPVNDLSMRFVLVWDRIVQPKHHQSENLVHNTKIECKTPKLQPYTIPAARVLPFSMTINVKNPNTQKIETKVVRLNYTKFNNYLRIYEDFTEIRTYPFQYIIIFHFEKLNECLIITVVRIRIRRFV